MCGLAIHDHRMGSQNTHPWLFGTNQTKHQSYLHLWSFLQVWIILKCLLAKEIRLICARARVPCQWFLAFYCLMSVEQIFLLYLAHKSPGKEISPVNPKQIGKKIKTGKNTWTIDAPWVRRYIRMRTRNGNADCAHGKRFIRSTILHCFLPLANYYYLSLVFSSVFAAFYLLVFIYLHEPKAIFGLWPTVHPTRKPHLLMTWQITFTPPTHQRDNSLRL